MGFTNLNPNYLESLNLHLSISNFIDVDHPDYDRFRNRFFQAYHVVPDINAYMGYDFMAWLATTVSKEGMFGLIQQNGPAKDGMASGFSIKPVMDEHQPMGSEMKTPLYYENRRIRILRYQEQDYQLTW